MKTIFASALAATALLSIPAFANEATHGGMLVSKPTVEASVTGSAPSLGQSSFRAAPLTAQNINDPARSAAAGK